MNTAVRQKKKKNAFRCARKTRRSKYNNIASVTNKYFLLSWKYVTSRLLVATVLFEIILIRCFSIGGFFFWFFVFFYIIIASREWNLRTPPDPPKMVFNDFSKVLLYFNRVVVRLDITSLVFFSHFYIFFFFHFLTYNNRRYLNIS